MRSEHKAMTIEEFELLPLRPGWKHEYYDGQAHLTVRPMAVLATVRTRVKRSRRVLPIRRVRPEDAGALIGAFAESFLGTAEYCDRHRRSVAASAKECITEFFGGKRGPPLTASRVACYKRVPVAAALVVQRAPGPLLDMLFVSPKWQRRGIATALVCAAISELACQEERTLASMYHPANEESAAWHKAFGFVEAPDLTMAQLRRRYAQRELWRRQKLRDLTPAAEAALTAEIAAQKAAVEALERRAAEEGYDAVCPILRYERRTSPCAR